MEIRDLSSKLIGSRRHNVTRKFVSGWALAIALLVAGAGVSWGQETLAPQADPQASPTPKHFPPPKFPQAQAFILNDGAVHLGVSLSDVTPEKAQELKLPTVAGAIVTSVEKDSTAAKAGIETGDTIIEFDGDRVRSSAQLRRMIRETPAGRTVEMKIVRDGKTRVLSAKLEATTDRFSYSYNGPEVHIFNMPEIHIPPMDFPEFPSGFGAHRTTLGISGDDLTPQLAQYFGAKQGTGVLISEVTKGGAADKAGLKAGDVIVRVDGKSISGVEELRDALSDNFTGDTRQVVLIIVRDHHEQTVNADLTRSQTWEKHTSSTAGSTRNLALAQARAQADQQRAQAAQARAMAESQRALVRAEVLKQAQQVHAEWQHQLQEQMRSLADQLKQMQTFHVALHQDGEI